MGIWVNILEVILKIEIVFFVGIILLYWIGCKYDRTLKNNKKRKEGKKNVKSKN